MKFSMEGATPTFEDNDGQTITAGGHVRLRIKGIRSELNQMFAIGSIREDYLGYELAPLSEQVIAPITDRMVVSVLCSTSRCSDITDTTKPNFFGPCSFTVAARRLFFSCSCYSGVPQIWTSARRWRHGARERAKRENHIKARKAMFTFFMSSNKIPNRNSNCSFSLLGHRFTSLIPTSRLPHQSINNHPSPTTADKPPNASQTPHQPP